MKIGFTASAFDLLHAGHILMLAEAKEQCDYLIVGLHTDPTIDRPDTKNKPIQSVFERFTQLQAVKFIDEIVPYDTEADLLAILQSYKIHLRIIGEDYKDKPFTGKELPIPVYYNSRKHNLSTTELRNRIAEKNVLDRTSVKKIGTTGIIDCYTYPAYDYVLGGYR
jgi:glycerol-3-phosphate cytidylyltransferase